MPAPVTLGQIREKIADMEIGDYTAVIWDSTLGSYKTSSNPSSVGGIEMPLNGFAYGTNLNNYYSYWIKVDKGLLIGDRVTHFTVAHTTLVNSGAIDKKVTLGGAEGYIRMPTGGVAYADVNGQPTVSSEDLGFGGFPSNNEWDKYIVKGDCNGKIVAGSDDVWHWGAGVSTWCLDYPSTLVSSTPSTARTIRGKNSGVVAYPTVSFITFSTSTLANATIGWRPVFEYKEV